MPGMVAHIYNSSTWEFGAGGPRDQGQIPISKKKKNKKKKVTV
jgi:hypothetical protein